MQNDVIISAPTFNGGEYMECDIKPRSDRSCEGYRPLSGMQVESLPEFRALMTALGYGPEKYGNAHTIVITVEADGLCNVVIQATANGQKP